MPLFLDRIGTESPPNVWAWRPRDCSLYALAVGAGFEDRAFVLESAADAAQQVYPTFLLSLVSADAATRDDDLLGIGDFTGRTMVLGDQALVLDATPQPSGEVSIVTRVADVYDKGSGALVLLEVTGTATAHGDGLFTATMGMFVVGEGGFGGPRGPGRRRVGWPARPPDHVRSCSTSAVQSLWYRHAGHDDHGIHVDADAARAAGFDGPILTGQNTLGVACRAVVHAVCGSDPGAMRSIAGRFSAPGYNGDVLTTEMWTLDPPDDGDGTGRRCVFRVVNQHGHVLVDDGECELVA